MKTSKQKKSLAKQIVGKLHLWLGLASGGVVLILGITGCIYVFIDELKPVVYKDRWFVKDHMGEKKPLSTLLQTAQTAVGEHRKISTIRIPMDDDKTFIFRAYKGNRNSEGLWFWEDREYYYTTFVDPYQAKAVKTENSTFEFFSVILALHWSLLLNDSIGQPIVGIATLLFVISLLTGLVLWWPKNTSAAKQRFWFKWKDSTKWRRKNYDLHNIFGFYMMVFALLIALTGLVWAFKWFNDSVQWIANGGKTYERPQPLLSDTTTFPVQNPLDKVFAHAQQNYPDAKHLYVYMPQNNKGTINISVNYGGGRHHNVTSLRYDQHSGKLLKTSSFADKNNGEKIRALNYDIHVGSILGLPGKILAFLASFVAASLPVTGFIIWRGRKKKAAKSVKSSSRKKKLHIEVV